LTHQEVGIVARAYIRYTCNGVKLGCWGGNTRGVVDHFNDLKKDGLTTGLCVDSYLYSRKIGDVVLLELLKRGKKKPRVPRDLMVLVITDLVFPEGSRWVSHAKVSVGVGS
jgi:hypothetical protein